MSQDNSDVVVDRGAARLDDLWRKEDYWAIWIGFFIMAVAIFLVFSGRSELEKKYNEFAPIIKEQKAISEQVVNGAKAQAIEQINALIPQSGLTGAALSDFQSKLSKFATVKEIVDEAQKHNLDVSGLQNLVALGNFKTIELINAQAAQKAVQGQKLPAVKAVIDFLRTPARWQSNPLDSLWLSKEKADALSGAAKPAAEAAKEAEATALAAAQTAQANAAAEEYKDASLNEQAATAIAAWQKAKSASSKAAAKLVKPFNRIPGLIILGLGLGVLCSIGALFMNFNVVRFFIAFLCVYAICVVANILGNQLTMRKYGFNAEIWSIALGMLWANTFGTPKLLKEGSQVEYYIKTGLVLLGAEVLFHKIMAIGIPGIFVAWVVTPIVLISTFIFGQKVLKMPSKTLNIVISADMSVCGTSAAIATAAAARAKKEELTLSIGLSLTFTAIMMVALPAFIAWVGLPEILGGAWIGGTVDATGAVAAAGAFIGTKALEVATVIKMIQNVLIGVTAFCVAIYWTTKVDVGENEHVGLIEIWNRFPKFVIGFLAVSVVMSILSANVQPYAGMLVDQGTNRISVPLRGWFFALAFVSIGLTTDFRALGKYFKGGKPVILYVCGQSFNLALTLLMAWIMFYKVFPEITARI